MNPRRSPLEIASWAVLGLLLLLTLIGAARLDRARLPLLGDEATYAMQAASLAFDFDLRYTSGDYQRFVAQWGGPPDGVILQSSDGGAHITYGKPFLYALVVAPFVRFAPVRGPLVANALMLAAAALLVARALRPAAGALAPLAVALLIFGSVSFAYVFWVHADLFLFAATAAGLALAYGSPAAVTVYGGQTPGEDAASRATGRTGGVQPQHVYVSSARGPLGRRYLVRWFFAGLLLAVPGAFRPFYLALLLPAALAVPAGRRLRGWGALAAGALALLLVTALVQHAAGGGWSGYSGERLGFYPRTGYPDVDFPASDWESRLRRWGNNSWVQEGAFDPSRSPRLWAWNALYFLIGRDIGVLPYFLPLLLGVLAFRGERGRWLLPLAVIAASACFLLVRPFNFYGGGGAVGNRYFLPLYPALWFLIARPVRAVHLALVAALAAPFLLPLWRQPTAFPIGEDGRYRHVSPLAQRLLPYETTQATIPGGQDAARHGLWIKLLDHDVWWSSAGSGLRPPVGPGIADNPSPPESTTLRMVGSAEAHLLVGTNKPLRFLAVELDRHAPARIDVDGRELRPSLLRPDGWEVFEVPLLAPRAVHPMWWTHDDFYLYKLNLRLVGGKPVPVGLDLGPGEDPERFDQDLEPAGGSRDLTPS